MSEQFWLNKECPICEQGRLFVTEDITNQRLYLHCEECECGWLNPEELTKGKSFLAINPDFEERIPSKETIENLAG